MLELLIYLRDILSNINLYLFSDTALLANDIRNLDISCKSLDLEKLIEPDLLSAKKGDILLLAMEVPELFLKDFKITGVKTGKVRNLGEKSSKMLYNYLFGIGI